MSSKAKSLEELRDSQILFDKDLPPFGYMIMSIFAVLLVGVLVWSMHATKAKQDQAEVHSHLLSGLNSATVTVAENKSCLL